MSSQVLYMRIPVATYRALEEFAERKKVRPYKAAVEILDGYFRGEDLRAELRTMFAEELNKAQDDHVDELNGALAGFLEELKRLVAAQGGS